MDRLFGSRGSFEEVLPLLQVVVACMLPVRAQDLAAALGDTTSHVQVCVCVRACSI